VVQDAREVRGRPGEQRGDDPRVELQAEGDRQRLRHGAARQLVPESDGVRADLQHPESLGLGDGPEVGAEHAQQRRVDPRRDDRELLDDLPRRGAQPVHPRLHGVDDGARHRLVRRGERLGDEERVSRGGPVQPAGVDRGPGGQLRHGVAGQPVQWQPLDGAAAEAAEHALQRVLAPDLVRAIGEQQQRGQVADPAADVAQQVERRAVRPVHVLDRQDGRPARVGQLLEDRREDLAGIIGSQRGGERAPGVAHRVAQGPQCARRQQVVARPGEHPAGPERPGEGTDQAGLPDPRLARDEHHRPGTAHCPVEGRVERAELGVAFEQRRHPGIVPAQPPSTAAFAGTAV
jgi:hypothetical protein